MSYVIPSESETGGPATQTRVHEYETIRKLTASQGARSDLYEVQEPTGKIFRRQRAERFGATSQKPLPPSAKTTIAELEHIGRLLRDCKVKSASLLESTDPVDSALHGSSLIGLLQELWSYKSVREPDWTEILNVLQIVLAKQEFENLSKEKRSALVRIFQEEFLTRTIGRAEVERTLQLLSDAGFDPWCGISAPTEDNS